MANWEFYDDEEEIDLTESEKEPSFSFYDFKKWLSKQRRQTRNTMNEDVQPKSVENKDPLKEAFKEKMMKRVEENIEKKMKDKRKKKR